MKKTLFVLFVAVLMSGFVLSFASKAKAYHTVLWPDYNLGVVLTTWELNTADWSAFTGYNTSLHCVCSADLITLYTFAVQLDRNGDYNSLMQGGNVIWPAHMVGIPTRTDPVARVIYLDIYGSHYGDVWAYLFEMPFYSY